MNYSELIIDDLHKTYHDIASKLSYHNAAEGGSWYAETKPRYACQASYKEICQEYKDRGLDVPKGNYLI